MKTTDVKCPVCGAMNRSLYLEETDGWMECEACGCTAHLMGHTEDPEHTRWQVVLPIQGTKGGYIRQNR